MLGVVHPSFEEAVVALTIAVDVAGTQIRAGLIDPHPHLQGKSTPFPLFQGPLKAEKWDFGKLRFDPDIINKIIELAVATAGQHKDAVEAIGIASTGAVDLFG